MKPKEFKDIISGIYIKLF